MRSRFVSKTSLRALSLSICALAAVAGAPCANAVPGLSSSSNVKEIVKLLKSYSGTNIPNIQSIEASLREHPTESAEALVNLLDTNDESLKVHVAQLLQRLSMHTDFTMSDDSIKTLVAYLKASHNAEVETNLLLTLGAIGPKTDIVKQAVIFELSSNREVSVRKSAVDALARLAREERPALHAVSTAALIDALRKDDSPAVRGAAAAALGNYRDNPVKAIPALTQALDDNYLQVRTKVVAALGQYGSSAQAAVPKLVTTLKTETDNSIKSVTVQALRQVDPNNDAVLEAYIQLLDDPFQSQLALSNLTNFGPKAAPAVPKLIELVKSGDRYKKQTAVRALGSVGPAASAAVPVLNEALKDGDAITRRYAEEALRNIQNVDTSQNSGSNGGI